MPNFLKIYITGAVTTAAIYFAATGVSAICALLGVRWLSPPLCLLVGFGIGYAGGRIAWKLSGKE